MGAKNNYQENDGKPAPTFPFLCHTCHQTTEEVKELHVQNLFFISFFFCFLFRSERNYVFDSYQGIG